MCSIFGVFDIKTDAVELRKKALELSRLMRHRGPDWSGILNTRLTEKVMCSIFGVFDIKTDAVELRKKALELSRLMRHRGPDWSGISAWRIRYQNRRS